MRIRRHVHMDEIAELNLVPYMDIMVNLIMFLLVSMTSFVEMKIINVSVPAIGPPPDSDGSTTPPPDHPQLVVVVGIVHKQGFFISLNGQFMDGAKEGEPTIGVKTDGSYDFDLLKKKLAEVKQKEPTLTALTIVPDKAVDYQTLVKTMDSMRRDDEQKVLFPDVLLGVQ